MAEISKRDKILLALIGASVIFFVIMDPYYMIWKKPPEPKPAEGVPADSQAVTDQTAQSQVQTANRPVKRITFEGWGRDPFTRVRYDFDQTKLVDNLKLSGISLRGSNSFALINSKIVKVGDEIEGMKVVAIKEDRVILRYKGREIIVTLVK